MSKATFVTCLQYGSTGKGKTAFHEARAARDAGRTVHFVRTGGCNSGHTIHTSAGEQVSFRQLGAGAALEGDVVNYIAAGCSIDEDRLQQEIGFLPPSTREKLKLYIDPRAVLLEPSDREAEAGNVGHMGTTASGNGESMIRRARRQGRVRLAGDSEVCHRLGRVESVAPLLHEKMALEETVIVEAVQGFELSLLHSRKYPYCTVRDTTVCAFASEVGLAPKHIGKVIGVMRSYPIRVGGNSGPMGKEITWDEVARRSGAPAPRPELTTVTKRLRRVAEFSYEDIKRACDYNSPDALAIMGIDNVCYADLNKRSFDDLSNASKEFIFSVEDFVGIPVQYIGTGPHTEDMIRR